MVGRAGRVRAPHRRGGLRVAGLDAERRSPSVYSATMTHVFVAPHPDDVALSCGGLVASLRELGQNVTILTVYSGGRTNGALTAYQREALGFGSKAIWPASEAFNRANLPNDYPLPDGSAELPPWAALEGRLDATQAEADAAARRFWQRSSWYRRANIHAEPNAGVPR